jgi:hypothetical protein
LYLKTKIHNVQEKVNVRSSKAFDQNDARTNVGFKESSIPPAANAQLIRITKTQLPIVSMIANLNGAAQHYSSIPATSTTSYSARAG